MNSFIFGNSKTEKIVSIEVHDGHVNLFIENEDCIKIEKIENNKYWILAPVKFDKECKRLNGDLHYKYIREFNNYKEYIENVNFFKYRGNDIYFIWDEKEALMTYYGLTYFKGLKTDEVSVLSFDIETTGLEHNDESAVLLISNTYRKNGKVIRKLFSFDDYLCQGDMIDDWCTFVQALNPSILLNHNIYGYDLPYLNFVAEKNGTSLFLGRDGSKVKFNNKDSKFRKDGSQSYSYKRCKIYGREIVDTLFLAIKYDSIFKKYDNYRLKYIIEKEGLEKKDRQHYDASKILQNYKIPEEFEKIKRYAEDDSDDALKLFDLMIAPYFYLTQSIPKTFQTMLTSASGAQVNSFLVRSYLQDSHSLPKESQTYKYEGAISHGLPGSYKNGFKIDVSSLYPSIILEYEVYDKHKDPNKHFLKMIEYFTNERLENKKKAKETGDRYYKDLEQSQKIIINSGYGFMAASGLLFNSPHSAEFITNKGREILKSAIKWATNKEYDEWKTYNNIADEISDNDEDIEEDA